MLRFLNLDQEMVLDRLLAIDLKLSDADKWNRVYLFRGQDDFVLYIPVVELVLVNRQESNAISIDLRQHDVVHLHFGDVDRIS